MKRLLAIGEALIDFIPAESGREMKQVRLLMYAGLM